MSMNFIVIENFSEKVDPELRAKRRLKLHDYASRQHTKAAELKNRADASWKHTPAGVRSKLYKKSGAAKAKASRADDLNWRYALHNPRYKRGQ